MDVEGSASFLTTLEQIGALKNGHFLLASGRHSGRYIEKFDLLRQPNATERACALLVKLVDAYLPVELVVGPTTGGILLAFEVARQLGVLTAYAERESDGSSRRVFKRGTRIQSGVRTLVVDDILTTGGSVRETLAALEPWGADVRAIGVLVDRSGGHVAFDAPLVGLATLEIETWESSECPLCRAGVPLIKPGSTSTA